MMTSHVKRALAAGAVVVTGVAGWTGTARGGGGGGPGELIGRGPDHVYGATPLDSAVAAVYADDVGTDGTRFTLSVSGVTAPAGTELGAHVHTDACGPSERDAGGHLQTPDGGPHLRGQEIWLDFRVDARGTGHAVATRAWRVADRANRSVVIHEHGTDHSTGAAGRRLACIDLDG